MKIHYVDGPVLYASRGYEIFRSSDAGESWALDGRAPYPGWRKTLDRHVMFRRVGRGGISGVFPLKDGARLCIVPKMIFRAEKADCVYRCVLRFSKGSRPLNLCCVPNGMVYWGEYFLNLPRTEPVDIYGSSDGGRNWRVVYRFPKGSICHIHRIVYDIYDHSILVCTGDKDHESGILKADAGFQNLETLVQGRQIYRTTCLVPVQSCILYGTDSPGQQNYIIALDRKSREIRKIQEIPGPVLYGYRAGKQVVFSTMLERQSHQVSIWAGDEHGFEQIALFPLRKYFRIWREIFGYPTVVLPEGNGCGPDVHYTPLGINGFKEEIKKMRLWKNS